MLNSFAPLAWVITLILAVCFVFNLLSGRGVGGARFNWVLGLAVVLWVLYSCWETFYIDPVRDNIRVDLLVIFPVFLIVTVAGLIRWLKG
jgi:hypothetical protein